MSVMKTTCSVHFSTDGQKPNYRHNCDKDYRSNLAHTENDRKITILEDHTNKNFQLDLETKVQLLKEHRFADGSSIQDYLDEYNKGKKPSRQKSIEDLASQKKQGGKEFFSPQEIILQIGNKNDQEVFNLGYDPIKEFDRQECCEILEKEFKKLKEDNSDKWIILQASIHDDESTPHLHLVYLPIGLDFEERKKGLPISTSKKVFYHNCLSEEQREEVKTQIQNEQTLASLDYDPLTKKHKKPSKKTKNQIKRDTDILEFTTFRESIVKDIADMARPYGYQIENPNRKGQEHLNTNDFREAEKIKNDSRYVEEARLKLASMDKTQQESKDLRELFDVKQTESLKEVIVKKWNGLVKMYNEAREQVKTLLKHNEELEQVKNQQQQTINKLDNLNQNLNKQYQEELYKVGGALYREGSNLETIVEDNSIDNQIKEVIYQGFKDEEKYLTQSYDR